MVGLFLVVQKGVFIDSLFYTKSRLIIGFSSSVLIQDSLKGNTNKPEIS